MKKLLGIVVLGLLLIPNYSEAKTKDIGNGLIINIPKNYKYFEIDFEKLYSIPELKYEFDKDSENFYDDKIKIVKIRRRVLLPGAINQAPRDQRRSVFRTQSISNI